jgi:hypothetical protein
MFNDQPPVQANRAEIFLLENPEWSITRDNLTFRAMHDDGHTITRFSLETLLDEAERAISS